LRFQIGISRLEGIKVKKIKHDEKLDKNKKLKSQVEYYDKVQITKEFDLSKAVRRKGKNKQVKQ
jgi:hypothetical protein